ncbi:MAG: T9SS type A sorting domain-containing protein [Candidatus Zixiibacteriota bacterium]|nr:MAG: T9SS type A sorting domain-containing protein [candidate division Zixibacteria bacterium]
MKKLLLLALATCLIFNVASARKTLYFGNTDLSDVAVTIDSDIEIPVWYVDAADPVDPIAFLHIPLASNDTVITSRDGGTLESVLAYPTWDDCSFLDPDPDQPTLGWTSQSILGWAELGGPPPDGVPLVGSPTPLHIATYLMHTANEPAYVNETMCAFQQGYNPTNHGVIFGDTLGTGFFYPGMEFSCLFFTPNNDPVWGPPPEIPGCIDAGIEFCFDLSGTDVDDEDDLHIYLISGPEGVFTETAGGPGGYAAGTWCGTPRAGFYFFEFELNDNAGGVIPLNFSIFVADINLTIDCPSAVPGAEVWVPVTLYTCEFLTGGFEILMSWDPTVLDLIEVVPGERINFGEEYWNVRLDDGCEECPPGGSARIVWIADLNNGYYTPPAAAGWDPIFWMHFLVDYSVPFGVLTNIEFVVEHYSDNTISDETGYVFYHPLLSDGCVNIIDPSTYKGDPNMNGWYYEIADAVLVARRLIEGTIVWTENGTSDDDIQEIAADLNNNGFADVADLVRFINIINGNIDPPKLDPTSEVASFTMPNVVGNEMTVTVRSALDLGGALISIDHTGIELGEPIAHGMEVLAHDADGVLNLVVYSLEGNTITAGKADLVTIPVIANNGGTMEFGEVSAADSYGRLLESTASLVAPLPTEFAVKTNYPNPFNARTMINFDLPIDSDVNVNIYSITGQLVETISGQFEAGSHSVTWDATDVASGVYFYKVSAGDFSQTMKMTLLK